MTKITIPEKITIPIPKIEFAEMPVKYKLKPFIAIVLLLGYIYYEVIYKDVDIANVNQLVVIAWPTIAVIAASLTDRIMTMTVQDDQQGETQQIPKQ